jgi:transketolase C-terminal domain/subunit
VVDDNDVTIAGHPSDYLEGYSVAKTLAGHGLTVSDCDGEDLDALFARLREAVTTDGPVAVMARRKMCVGIESLEGNPKGHDVIGVDAAVAYLTQHGQTTAVEYLQGLSKSKHDYTYQGSGDKLGSNRNVFGDAINEVLDGLTDAEKKNVMVIDSDLEGSCGLATIRKANPEVFVRGGIMERGNLSAAAGFGYEAGKQGIFATFSAFLEMCLSELTMARLNKSNLLCHFSHAGVDDMADNTCHFGLNNLFADNGLDDDEWPTRVYFPADAAQMTAVVKRVFSDPGLRFVFSTRSKTPNILTADGTDYYGDGYTFTPGTDELIRDGKAGYIVAIGDTVYRAIDAAERLGGEGIDVGVVNKPTLNVVDEQMLQKIGTSQFVVVVESLSRRNGLGSRMGTWLLERGLTPKFARLGTHREGCGGLHEHFYHQGIDPASIMAKVKELA